MTAAPAYRGTPPLPVRPEISGPPAPAWTQPLVGLAGLTFIGPLFFVLAFGGGGAEASLHVLGPLTTFSLPVIAMIAFWWEDWPGSTLRAPWSGLTDTLMVMAAAVALTVAGQGVVSGIDLRAVFTADPGPGHVATFPGTMPLAAGAFTAILQLTLVTEGWPLRGLGRVRSGLAALAVSWLAGLAGYLLIVEHGPVGGGAYGAWLTAVGVWQMVFFMALRGWPFSGIARRGLRLPTGNAVVIAAGWASYLVLRRGLAPDRIAAICGTLIAAVLLVSMLFEAWPWTGLTPLPGRACALAAACGVAGLLYWALSAYTGQVSWERVTPDEWVTHAALNAVGIGVILHVAVWRRWPVLTGPVRGEGDPP